MPEEPVDGALEGMPPSAKLVAKVMEYEGSMDAEEISRSARLHPSTTRDALNRLVEENLVEVSVDPDGGRRLVYSIEVGTKRANSPVRGATR